MLLISPSDEQKEMLLNGWLDDWVEQRMMDLGIGKELIFKESKSRRLRF
jgi:hypothetical protein